MTEGAPPPPVPVDGTDTRANEREAPRPDMGKRVFFVADPMCSWCWGFAPVIRAIDGRLGGRASLRVVVGGLRVGTDRIMTEKDKAYVRHHWEEVAKTTGQPFSFDFFDREGFVYDTGPACHAVVTVRSLDPPSALPYLEALHKAFYVDGRDTTDADTLAAVAESLGVDADAFRAVFAAPEVVEATNADFRLARTLGVTGFPTVVCVDEGGAYGYLTMGYRPFEDLDSPLQAWLSDA